MATDVKSESSDNRNPTKHVVSASGSGGPQGYGDPEDRTLRKIEKTVLISNIVRQKMTENYCKKEYEAFQACGKASGLAIAWKCRQENTDMKKCYQTWFTNPDLVEESTEQYLAERARFRRTGIMKPKEERTGTREWKYARQRKAQEAAAAEAAAALSSQQTKSDGEEKA